MSNYLKLFFLALAISMNAAWAGDFEDGEAAYAKNDFSTALTKYKSAAAQGDAKAQLNLGIMYGEGQGVVQDYAESVRWYKLAAAQGNAKAQNNLAIMYGAGQGGMEDYKRAHMWFNLAAVKGYSDAVKNRDIVAKRMTPQQIAEAQKLARECQARNFKNCD